MPTNNILLQVLASKSGKSVDELCDLIKMHFANNIITLEKIAASKPSDFDFKLGPNKPFTPESRATTQPLRQDGKADPEPEREREHKDEHELDMTTKKLITEAQFVLARIKSSLDFRQGITLYKDQDDREKGVAQLEKNINELKQNCTTLLQSCKKIMKSSASVQGAVIDLIKSDFTIDVIRKLYYKQVQDKYITYISDILSAKGMSSDNIKRANNCLKLLQRYSALKSSEEMATADNVKVIGSFYGLDETEALIAHIRIYSVNANDYIERWLNKSLDPGDAPALYSPNFETTNSSDYSEVNKCFDTINDIINANGGLILRLLSDLMHTFSTDPLYNTKPILEAICPADIGWKLSGVNDESIIDIVTSQLRNYYPDMPEPKA
jgi:hypothetical protein